MAVSSCWLIAAKATGKKDGDIMRGWVLIVRR